MKKIYCLLLTALLYAGVVNAQNDFSLNEQLFSRIAINPAGTGNSANVNLFTLGRFQYAGMEGSPYTVLLNAHGYIEKASSGVGLSVSYDKSGIAYHQVQAKAVYAYHLNFGRHNILSFGVGLGIMNKQFDPSNAIVVMERPMVNPTRFKSTTSALRCFEAELTLIEHLGFPYCYVDSKDWQKILLPKGIKGADEQKKASKDIGKRLFPQLADFKHTDYDGILIAEYARRKNL